MPPEAMSSEPPPLMGEADWAMRTTLPRSIVWVALNVCKTQATGVIREQQRPEQRHVLTAPGELTQRSLRNPA